VRAPARKPRWLNPAPCTAAKGIYLVGACKQELAGGTLLGDAVDVTRKRNGGEDAWSLFRISRAPDTSSTKRRCACCIGCAKISAKRNGRPKKASTDTGLSNVDISYDQSSRWQKLAAISAEIFEREVQGKTHGCCRLVISEISYCWGIRPAGLGTAFQCPRCGQRTSTQTTAESSIVWGEPRGLLSRRRSGF
jgi:hypothetical protein